jgi:hypothetical protein
MKQALSSSETWILTRPHGVTPQKTPFFIVTAVKTSMFNVLLSRFIDLGNNVSIIHSVVRTSWKWQATSPVPVSPQAPVCNPPVKSRVFWRSKYVLTEQTTATQFLCLPDTLG